MAARGQGEWNPRAVELCVLARPEFLLSSSAPLEIRRTSLTAFYAARESGPNVSTKLVRRLLRGPLTRRASGQLDLWAIGAILQLVRKNAYSLLLEEFTANQIISAFWEAPE